MTVVKFKPFLDQKKKEQEEQRQQEWRFEMKDKAIMPFFSMSTSWVQDFEGNIK